MKTKTLSFIIASVFAFVFLVSAVSAVALNDIALVSSPSEVSNDAGSFEIVFTLTNGGDAGNLYYNLSNFTSSQSGLTFSFNDSDIADGSSTEVTETITATVSFDEGQTGTITGNINVGNTDSATDETLSFSVLLNEVEEEPLTCDYNQGSLRVSIEDIKVISGFGDDDEWLTFDEIELEIEIENKNNDEKIKNVELEWGLWSQETEEWVIELDDIDEFDISKDDSEVTTITFKLNEKDLDVDLEDLEEGDYTIYVRAKGEEQEDPEFDVCSIDSAEVQLFLEDDFVILNDIEIFPETIQCDSTIQLTADVWNMGSDDQEDVVVVIYNSELGISKEIEIGDIDAFDSEPLDFSFELPDDAEEKTYSLKLTVYDEDHDVYENDYDDSQAIFSVFLKVEEGSCSVAEASVNAVLETGGKAGQPLVIKATITNTGDKSTTYLLNAAAYTEWASAASLDQSTLILDAGESQDVLLTFDVKKEALGDNLFTLEVLSDNELIVSKPVQVTITKKGLGITGGAIFGDDWYLWGIGALNVILIVLIIVIAIRIARK